MKNYGYRKPTVNEKRELSALLEMIDIGIIDEREALLEGSLDMFDISETDTRFVRFNGRRLPLRGL